LAACVAIKKPTAPYNTPMLERFRMNNARCENIFGQHDKIDQNVLLGRGHLVGAGLKLDDQRKPLEKPLPFYRGKQ
jgi:hypothetical protein